MIIPDKQQFNQLAGIVIDKLEGGYFHPYMYRDNPQKFRFYGSSGETLFGLDRHAGHDLFYTSRRISSNPLADVVNKSRYKYKNAAAAKFWTTIDQANASIKWKWNSRGGDSEKELKVLAIDIIYNTFIEYLNKFLTDAEKATVFQSPDLLFLFIYATWNGAGFFKNYAQRLRQRMKAGTIDPNKLAADQIKARQDSQFFTIRNTADKILSIFNSDTFKSLKANFDTIKNNLNMLPLIATLFFLYIFANKNDRNT